jgi:hypothetical protein
MIKICQTGLIKLNFETRVSGMGGYTSKCEKIQNHCTLLTIHEEAFSHF